MATQSDTNLAEKHSFSKSVAASFFANILFASLLGGGLYFGYKKKLFDLKELIGLKE